MNITSKTILITGTNHEQIARPSDETTRAFIGQPSQARTERPDDQKR